MNNKFFTNANMARIANYKLHAEQLFIPKPNAFLIESDSNPQIVFSASGQGFKEQLTSDGYIENGEFEQRIDLAIQKTKDYMRSNNCENIDGSILYYKDYSNGVFDFKLYFQDLIIPVEGQKKVIRYLVAYFVEPRMHDFYEFTLSAGPFVMPTEKLRVGTIDLQTDQITMTLDKLMKNLLDNLKYKD